MGIFNEQIPTDKISTNVQGQQGPPDLKESVSSLILTIIMICRIKN